MKWMPAEEFIGGLACIKSEVTEEVKLQGRYGDIWLYDEKGRYSALITSHRVANALFKRVGKKGGYKVGDEALLHAFSKDLLTHVIRAIEPFKTQKGQIEKANEIDGSNLAKASNSGQNTLEPGALGVRLSGALSDENRPSLSHPTEYEPMKIGA